MNHRRYTELNATLEIAHQAGSFQDMRTVLNWLNSCLNCNTNHAEVTISRATPSLGWPDFLDAPTYGPEHRDYPSDVRMLNAVEQWLDLDRKGLIRELIRMHDMLESGEKLPPADLANEQLIFQYRQARLAGLHMDEVSMSKLKADDLARYNLMLAVAFDVDARPSRCLDPNGTGWFVSTPEPTELPSVQIPTAETHDQAIALAVDLLGLEALFLARLSKKQPAAA